MKTPTKLTLNFLENALEDLLQAKLQPLEPMVRCRLESSQAQAGSKVLNDSTALLLKIFIQHQHDESNHLRVGNTIQQVLRLSRETINQAEEAENELSGIQHICVLLFFTGQKSPYAKRHISLASAGALPNVLPSASTAKQSDEASHGGDRPSSDPFPTSNPLPTSNQQTDTSLTQSSPPQPEETIPEAPPSDLPSPQPEAATKTASPDTPCFWHRWNIIKAIAAGILLSFSGITGYALTRPCVVGTCDVISTARALNNESQRLLNTASIPGEVITAEEVVTAYENLVEANYQLARIPFWSQYYDAAQALLSEYQKEADFVSKIVLAQRQAYEATLSAQEAPHPLSVWEDIRGQWQEAIAQLSTVPPDAGVTPLATTKLSEYQQYLSDIDQQIDQERAAQEKITEARRVAQIAEARESSAESAGSWQLVFVTWQVVINRLAEVPKDTMAYAEAQQLNAIYSNRLAASQERHLKEQQSHSAYTEARSLAAEAMQHEQSGRLTQALVAWQNALSNIQQISEETSYYDPAQPLLSSYGEELARTEEALATLAILEDYRILLNRACTNNSPVCSYILEPGGIQIFITDAYAEGVRQYLSAEMAAEQENSNLSEGSPQLPKVTALLQTITTIGSDSQIAIKLFDDEEQLIAIYEPSEGEYIQANPAVTSEGATIE